MNTKFLLTILFALLCSVSLSAQDFAMADDFDTDNQEQQVQQKGAFKTTFKKNKLRDNWIFSLGSGGQVLFGEDDSKGKFGSRITYAPTFSVSKYFSPIWGLRVSFTGGSLHGFNDGRDGTYRKWNSGDKHYMGKGFAGQPGYPSGEGTAFQTWDPSWTYRGWGKSTSQHPNWSGIKDVANGYEWDPGAVPDRNKALYMQHIRYFGANFNFMFDLITLFGKYNPKRVFDITPFAGVGYYHVFPHMGYGAYDTFGANAGLITKFRLSNRINLFAEFSGTMLPEDFDGHLGDNVSFDAIGQATAGISFKVGKTTWDVCEPMNYALVNDLMDKINDLQVIAAIPCPDCPPCPEPEIIEEPIKEAPFFLPDPVFFRIDKSVIDNSEWSKIEKAVDYLKQHPEAHVVVTGYADKKTAYPAYNLKLSERRSKTVAKALTTKYGINPARISIDWEGDQIQPFDINEWNRVVIFVIK